METSIGYMPWNSTCLLIDRLSDRQSKDQTLCSKEGRTTDSCKHPIPTTLHTTSHPLHQTLPTDFLSHCRAVIRIAISNPIAKPANLLTKCYLPTRSLGGTSERTNEQPGQTYPNPPSLRYDVFEPARFSWGITLRSISSHPNDLKNMTQVTQQPFNFSLSLSPQETPPLNKFPATD
jgi:hypothetical protein